MAATHLYCLNMVVWYCLLSSLNKANTLQIKKKLWKPMPAVIQRAHSHQSSLWTVIVSVDQEDWQIMHIYYQPLQHRYPLIILILLYLSKTNIHSYTCMWFPLQASKRDPEWWWGHGLIWESIRKLLYPPRLLSLLLQGKGLFLCLCVWECAYRCACIPVGGCGAFCTDS